jgi:hypothetical protein
LTVENLINPAGVLYRVVKQDMQTEEIIDWMKRIKTEAFTTSGKALYALHKLRYEYKKILWNTNDYSHLLYYEEQPELVHVRNISIFFFININLKS